MTLVRMTLVHGVRLTAEQRATLVKHLADTQGLAPAETSEHRFILEKQPNVVEPAADETLTAMCARCHTYARIALQRRNKPEWEQAGTFPPGTVSTLEYQALSRDRTGGK